MRRRSFSSLTLHAAVLLQFPPIGRRAESLIIDDPVLIGVDMASPDASDFTGVAYYQPTPSDPPAEGENA